MMEIGHVGYGDRDEIAIPTDGLDVGGMGLFFDPVQPYAMIFTDGEWEGGEKRGWRFVFWERRFRQDVLCPSRGPPQQGSPMGDAADVIAGKWLAALSSVLSLFALFSLSTHDIIAMSSTRLPFPPPRIPQTAWGFHLPFVKTTV